MAEIPQNIIVPINTKLRECVQQKCSMLVKKIQDRKTTEIFMHNQDEITLDEVQDILELSEQQVNNNSECYETTDSITISILATMKTIAHTTQSRTRWAQFAREHNVNEDPYIFSSKGDFTKPEQIVDSITDEKVPRHIVMCTHQVRIRNIVYIARKIDQKNTQLKHPRKLRIYLDEFDKYVTQMREDINELVCLNSVECIVMVTATPKNIWDTQSEWDKILILNPRILDSDDSYLMFKDCDHKEVDCLSMPNDNPDISYIGEVSREINVLCLYHLKIIHNFPDILTPNKVIFAPGLVPRKSHEAVSKLWNRHGCASFIFNGERTVSGYYGRLTLPDNTVIDIPHLTRRELFMARNFNEHTCSIMKKYFEDTNEQVDLQAQLNEIISAYYLEYHLEKYVLVMTGLLCIERAQTLVHPVWGTFSDAIYFKAANPDDAYQQQRQLGHIKKWANFRGKPRVFAPDQFRRDVLILEKRADSFANNHNGKMATVADYLNQSNGEKTSHEIKEDKKTARVALRSRIVIMDKPAQAFNNIDEVNKYLKNIFKSAVRGVRDFHMKDGFQLSTRLTSYYKKNKDDLVAEDRLTEEKFHRMNKTQNISDNKGQSYMVYPVYPTMSSMPNEVKYYLSYLPPN